ncbi:MAG TPA: serine hydroxymethyltransferase [Alphaproteobacteria bacterium]|nr:serine hydroxymethyltransferase [Alphaproteobacteria bacterium]
MSVNPQSYRDLLAKSDPTVFNALLGEEQRQREGFELIPSENYAFPEVLALLGSSFTNKYAEGYPGRRYYGGTEFVDIIENAGRERAKKLFRAEHANIQPLSGSPMNQAVYLQFIPPGETILAMDLSHGGHLTHGAPVSHMGKIYRFVRYKTNPKDGSIDFGALREVAKAERPKLIVCGYSSYPRDLDYSQFQAIANEVGALTMADVSHYGGFVAAGALKNPMDAGFDFLTTTTHKSMRGPRGGLIVCKAEHAKGIDASVFPGLQGGPHMNQVAATATALHLVDTEEFRLYARQVLANAKALAAELMKHNIHLVTGGTDNHLMVLDVMQSFGINGAQGEKALDHAGITTNKQVIPDDPHPPLRPSGVRMGTPAPTSRGMKEPEMRVLAGVIAAALKQHDDAAHLAKLRAETKALCARFPVPGL